MGSTMKRGATRQDLKPSAEASKEEEGENSLQVNHCMAVLDDERLCPSPVLVSSPPSFRPTLIHFFTDAGPLSACPHCCICFELFHGGVRTCVTTMH
jgi:hypothetical protein